MSTRKNMTFPIVLTFIIIAIIVYLFANLEQSEVSCEKTKTFDGDVRLTEKLVAVTDGKEINSIKLTKVIVLPEKYLKDDHYLNGIKNALSNTLDYLGDKVKYTIGNDRVTVTIEVDKNEILLLDNIDFVNTDDLQIKINSNTKSSEVITLSVGDHYTDGELMTRFKNNGYNSK